MPSRRTVNIDAARSTCLAGVALCNVRLKRPDWSERVGVDTARAREDKLRKERSRYRLRLRQLRELERRRAITDAKAVEGR
jgi:hypothetical protein